MNEQEKQQLQGLLDWKRQLESSSSIPLKIRQSFTRGFSIPRVFKRELTFSNTAAQQSTTVTVAIPDAQIGDVVIVTPSAGEIIGNLGGIFIGHVSAAGIVSVRFINPDTGSALNPGVGTYTIAIIKP